LGLGVLQDYNKLRPDTQSKNIVAWMPVVAEILDGFCRFDDKAVRVPLSMQGSISDVPQFARYMPAIYPLATGLLARDIAPEIRHGLRLYFVRVGYAQGITENT
jgi:brefeldin A-inhibited guanine nucleotide-exchange protein